MRKIFLVATLGSLSLVQSAQAATWPIDSAVTDYRRITGTFGESHATYFHEGTDITPLPACGSQVLTAVRGQGVKINFHSLSASAGYWIELSGTLGNYRYMHLQQHTLVPQSSWDKDLDIETVVPANGVIGLTSNTGPAGMDCHLHLETGYVNPLTLFSIPDTNGDEIHEIKIRLPSGQLESLTNGAVFNLSGTAEFLVRANDWTSPSVAKQTGNRVNYHIFESFYDDTPLRGQNYTSFMTMPATFADAYSTNNPASGFPPNAWYKMGSRDLTEGQHEFCLRRYHLNNGASQEIGTMQDTCVGRNIADPHFLVGDEKLIFSESAISNGRNPAFSGIHHSESHSRSITARGHLAGGQA